jgi:hypothetical protein
MVDENCQFLIGGKRCGIRRFPERGSPAFNDLNPSSMKDAINSRYEGCQPGSHGCFPKYSKGLATRKWRERAGFD